MKIDHFSHSQYNTFMRCGEQYRRRYMEGDIAPPGIRMISGGSTHVGIDHNYTSMMNTGQPLPTDEIRQLTADECDRRLEKGFTLSGDYEEMGEAKAKGFAKDEAVGLAVLHSEVVAPTVKPTAVEQRIELPPSDALPITFVSILDVIDDGRIIRDTKTKTSAPNKDMADTSAQLTSQSLAFQATYQKPPEKLTLDFLVRTVKTGKTYEKIQETTRDLDDQVAWVQRANTVLKGIEAEIFLPALEDSWACTERFCGFYKTCPYTARGVKRARS